MVFYFSSPIGLGHVTRDVAIIQKILEYSNDFEFDFITGAMAFQFISEVSRTSHVRNLRASNLYFPPQFSIDNGMLQNNLLWLMKYLVYFRKSKVVASKILSSKGGKDDKTRVAISDEDIASISVARDMGMSSIYITDILKTRFIRNRMFSLVETSLNNSMQKLVSQSKCVIVPEFGDNKDNIFYVGPIVRGIKKDRAMLRRDLKLNKKTILITTGGTSAGDYLIEKILQTLSTFINKFDFDILISHPNQLPIQTKSPIYFKNIGFLTNMHEYIFAADLVISLAGKSTIDECMAYGTPGIFIPIKNHFEQEDRAKKLGFSFDDINKLDSILVEYLSNLGSRTHKCIINGDAQAAKIILSYLNKY